MGGVLYRTESRRGWGKKVKEKKKEKRKEEGKHTFWQNPEHHFHNIFPRYIIHSVTETFIPLLLSQRAPLFPLSCNKYSEPVNLRSAPTPTIPYTTVRPGKCYGSQRPGGDQDGGAGTREREGVAPGHRGRGQREGSQAADRKGGFSRQTAEGPT